ncbi:MAG: DUF1571 domain-containing protein [Gemmataceae bacterium]
MRDPSIVLLLLAAAAPLARGEDARPNPMDEPLRLVALAKASYAKVADYQCVLIKREKLDGDLGPNQVIDLKVRSAPFSVSMRWTEPKPSDGQEVCYVAGKNDGKMRVKPGGLLGSIGFVSIDPEDPRAKRTSRHPVTRAGIGHVIDAAEKGWSEERAWGVTDVRVGVFLYAKRKCTRVEITHPTPAGGKFLHHKNVVFFDLATALPIRVENYDWPAKPGLPPDLVEVFSYVNLRLNVALPDATFQR